MRKIITLILAIVSALSLCACGGEESNGGGNKIVLREPTEEEYEMIDEYTAILSELDDYIEGGSISFIEYDEKTAEEKKWYGIDALGRYYKRLQELKDIDKWIGTEYCEETRTCQNILDSFKVIKDVKISATQNEYDRLGKLVDEINNHTWNYDENGTVIYDPTGDMRVNSVWNSVSDAGDDFARLEVYDDAGKVTEIQYFYDNLSISDIRNGEHEPAMISTPTFDSQGRIISELVKASESDISVSYAYDSTGRIIKVESVEKMLLEETVYTTTSIYTYNEAGALIKMECSKIRDWKDTRLDTYGKSTDSSVEEFFYDDEGCLVSSIYCKYYSNEQKGYIPVINQERERKTITYKTDKKGRVIEEQYETENLTTYKTVYTYGDYYIYSPAK